MGNRPNIELYNVKKDPYQLHNLATNKIYAKQCAVLKAELFAYLKETKDPRIAGKSPWDNYPYFFEGMEGKYLLPIGK